MRRSTVKIFCFAAIAAAPLAAVPNALAAQCGRVPRLFRPIAEPIPAPAPVKPKVPGKDGPAHVGETVTIDTDAGALKLTIDKLELSAERFKMGDSAMEMPSAAEKLLIVHYHLQNPNPNDVAVSGSTVRFTALDMDRKPHDDVETAVSEDQEDIVDQPLKSGDSVSAVKVIHVPARGPIAALLVTPGPAEATPMHVDVTGHVDKLAPPYVDPQDPTGFNALPAIEGKIGQTYQVGDCDLTLQDAEYSNDSLLNYTGEDAPDDEHSFAVFTFDVTCRNMSGESFTAGSFNPSLETIDGMQVDPANAPLLNKTLNLAFQSDLTYGDDRHFRVYFVVSKHDSMASLTISAAAGARKYIYDLSDVQRPPD